MKLFAVVVVIVAVLFNSCSAFMASRVCGSMGRTARSATEQTVKDLNLEEMFVVFDKADKTISSPSVSASVPFLPAPKNLKGLIGGRDFDPFGFSNFLPVEFLQEAEIKHGRIAMLAFLGFVTTELGLRLPGDAYAVSTLGAHDAAVRSGAAFQVIVAISLLEFISVIALKETLEGSGREPGDYGFDPCGLGKKDISSMKAKELENGRAAMIAFSGVVTQAVITGKEFPYI